MILSALRNLVEEQTAQMLKSRGADITVPVFDLSVPPPRIPGDLAANVVLMIAKQVGASPRELGEAILKSFPAHALVRKVEMAGAGFINIWLSDEALRLELENLLTGGREKKVAPKGAESLGRHQASSSRQIEIPVVVAFDPQLSRGVR